MTRLTAILLVLVVWAAIYLPGLGATELKGEEGRRILPAVTMLETGNWLVPYVGGKPFLRKPPLMNWLIAISFKLTAVRNEWTARLPSALAVLALGVTIVAVGGWGWMKMEAALSAALMAMTSFGLLAKARFAGAEIEGVYVPLFGIAITCWLAGWAKGWSQWKLWLLPSVFLGLAALAKGPIHLLFFYGIVIAVAWAEKRWRAFFHPAHFAGLAVMVAIFAAWAIPYFQTEAASKASKVWKDQMANRVTENHFEWKSYLTNLPRGLGDLLPWVLFVPVIHAAALRGQLFMPNNVGISWGRYPKGYKHDKPVPKRGPDDPRPPVGAAPEGHEAVSGIQPQVFRAVLHATAVMFVVLLLVPGILPRYVLPLGIPFALALAVVLQQSGLSHWPRRITMVIGALSVIYAIFAIPIINRHDNLRPLAREIDAALPGGATLTLYDPGYQAWIFYLRSPYVYAPYLEDVAPDAKYVLSRGGEKERRKFEEKRPDLDVTRTFRDKSGAEFILLEPRRTG